MLSDHDHLTLYGTVKREQESLTLTAGPLALSLQDGNIRTLRYKAHEVLRAAAFLVRDRDWGTCQPDITGLDITQNGNSFAVTYQATFRAPDDAVLSCHAEITGNASGVLTFAADFQADRDFETARAGFTVLHPLAGVVGAPVVVEHGDGTEEQAVWPREIDPWQPFLDIRAITHGVAPGLAAETRFAGDIFEMEDQRNWTDGSFKTYVRPLALPWPYVIPAGERVTQSITVTIRETGTVAPRPTGDRAVTLARRATDRTCPAIGIALRPDCAAGDATHASLPQQIGAKHLIAHFDPLAGHDLAVLEAYAQMTARTGLPLTLELALPCRQSPAEELSALAADIARADLALDSLFVSPAVDRQSTPPGSRWPDCPPLETVYEAAREAFPGVTLGGGMMSYFTELNRKRVPADRLDYISHCTNPIVHAADDLSVMQSFEALKDVVRSARALYPAQPYRIGPSTIAMRQNPYGSATKSNPERQRIPMADRDPRHNARFGAAWTLAYAAVVAEAGLDVLTLSTLTGPFGLIAEEGEPNPPGALRPLAAVLAALAALTGRPLVAIETSDPDRVLGLATGDTLLLANITPQPVTVALPDGDGAATDIVSGEPLPVSGKSLTLPPYGTARVTGAKS